MKTILSTPGLIKVRCLQLYFIYWPFLNPNLNRIPWFWMRQQGPQDTGRSINLFSQGLETSVIRFNFFSYGSINAWDSCIIERSWSQRYIKCIKIDSRSGSRHSGSQFCYDELRDYSRKRKHNQQLCEVSCNISQKKSITFSPSLADPCRKKKWLQAHLYSHFRYDCFFLSKKFRKKKKN